MLGIARGLDIIHACGIIHGDLKPENILIFNNNEGILEAKVADFSHSVLDTGEEQYLPGGTRSYAAPESRRKMLPDRLKKCDIYAYGLIVSTIAKGYDVVDRFLAKQSPDMTLEDRMILLDHYKQNGRLISFILELLYEADDLDLTSGNEEFTEVESLIKLTLSIDPEERDFQSALQWTESASLADIHAKLKAVAITQPVVKHMNENIVSIKHLLGPTASATNLS